MVSINGSGELTSIATKSYDTALCIIPPQWQCRSIDQLRTLYDKSYSKWPPHINLVYPFVDGNNLSLARSLLQSCLSQQYTGAPLNVVLDQVGHFVHRKNYTVFLVESQTEEESQIEALQRTLYQALGQDPRLSRLHLTIGQSENAKTSSIDFLVNKAKLLPHLRFQIFSLSILIREQGNSQGNSSGRMRLWGSVDIPAISPQQYSLAELWIPSEHTGKSFTLGSACGMTDASEISPFRTYKLNKRASQETTFCFDIAAQTRQSFLETPTSRSTYKTDGLKLQCLIRT